MIPRPLRQFISDLLEATDEKSVQWHEGSSEASYYCAHKSYNLHVSYHFNYDEGTGAYHFRIAGKNQDASFSVADMERDDFYTMNNLWSSIQINASGLEGIGKDFFN